MTRMLPILFFLFVKEKTGRKSINKEIKICKEAHYQVYYLQSQHVLFSFDELEKSFDGNTTVFRRKSQFYYSALTCALMFVIPYLVCLGFHIAKKDDSIYKVEIVNALKRQ